MAAPYDGPPLARRPTVRAIFLFALASLLRSRRHLFILATYVGLAIGVCLISLIAAEVRGTLSIVEPEPHLLAIPMVTIFFAVLGLRSACAVPADEDANWPFRLSEPSVPTAASATAAIMLTIGVAPVAGAAILVAWGAGWTAVDVLAVGFFDVASGALLIECVLLRWTKIPFTCAHVPAQETITSRWPFVLVALNLFAFQLAAAQWAALRSPRGIVTYLLAIGAMTTALRIVRERRTRGARVEFDAAEGGLQTLGLSEALQ